MADKHLDPGFGRDGISGLVTPDRALRAREVARPGPDDLAAARAALPALLARASGRRRPAPEPAPQSKIGPTVRVRLSSKNPG